MSFEPLSRSVISGKADQVVRHVNALLDAGEPPLRIINDGLIGGMSVVGSRFKEGEMFVPEVLVAAHAMNAGLEIVRPLLAGQETKTRGRMVLGTVKGDLHDIGRKLVGLMLESTGFEVINLGIDVAPAKFVEAVREHRPDIVGMSALLTTTMPAMQATIGLLTEAGLRAGVKVLVGGAPVTAEFAESIGADGFAPDAGAAADLCLRLVNAARRADCGPAR